MAGKLDIRSAGYSLFISDLHLCANRPHITKTFLDFLENTAVKADALYILGDLFEYWAGDDEIYEAQHQSIVHGLHHLTNAGVELYLMHGNRDFLISSGFCQATGGVLLADPSLITRYNKTVLLSHGDDLCKDDVDYQQFRLQVRDTKWQHDFLQLPLTARNAQIQTIRNRSEFEKSQKSMLIMDVNQAEVDCLLQVYGYPELFIHGHTHRPNKHPITLAGHHMTRWVLGDWYEQGSYLRLDESGCQDMQL